MSDFDGLVTRQPGPTGVPLQMEMASINGVPRILDMMTNVDRLTIKHDLEGVTPWNKYNIFDKDGKQIFHAVEEEGSGHERTYMGPVRGFSLGVSVPGQGPVLTLERSFKLCVGCCCADSCCYWPIQIYNSQTEEKIGMLRMRQTCCSFLFGAYDRNDTLMFTVGAKCCRCGNHHDFPVTRMSDNVNVANIAKDEPSDGVGYYTVTFLKDMDALSKTLIFCSVFTLEYILYSNEVGGERVVDRSGSGPTRYT